MSEEDVIGKLLRGHLVVRWHRPLDLDVMQHIVCLDDRPVRSNEVALRQTVEGGSSGRLLWKVGKFEVFDGLTGHWAGGPLLASKTSSKSLLACSTCFA